MKLAGHLRDVETIRSTQDTHRRLVTTMVIMGLEQVDSQVQSISFAECPKKTIAVGIEIVIEIVKGTGTASSQPRRAVSAIDVVEAEVVAEAQGLVFIEARSAVQKATEVQGLRKVLEAAETALIVVSAGLSQLLL